LAAAFLQNDLSKGFVVGVEGAWGSGKSSLVNLAVAELKNKENKVDVVEFTPWLIGSRNELLSQLFSDLEPVIIAALPENQRDDTRKLLKKYAEVSSGLATLADIAEAGGVPWASYLGKFIRKSGGEAAKATERSLSDLNKDLREKLKNLNRSIIIFIDDLDRLDPNEVVEVFRLIKAVADFPNVAYILAYDAEIISASLEKALRIPNGKVYLEKIIQASFKVPDAMSYDLKNWLKDEFSKIIGKEPLSDSKKYRLEFVYNSWCTEFLKTPRDVVRVLNSLRLNFVPVRSFVDEADMLFLQIIKTKNPSLFGWIEKYVSTLSSLLDGKFIPSGEDFRSGKKLLDVINGNDGELSNYLQNLTNHLPGIDIDSLVRPKADFRVYQTSVSDLKNYIEPKRLASPYHFSYYFSFSKPAGALDENEIESFLIACEKDPKRAISIFQRFISVERPQGGRLAEILLQRIIDMKLNVSPVQVEGLFYVLGKEIDNLIPVARTEYGYSQFLKGNRHQIFSLFSVIKDPERRISVLKYIFREASSIDWLTGIIREIDFDLSQKPGDRYSMGTPLLTL
jgi:hypothetical protein